MVEEENPFRIDPAGVLPCAEKGRLRMMHFTCDQCGKELRPDRDARYEIKLESKAAHDPREITDDDLEDDHIELLGELLRDLEAGEESPFLPPPKQEFRFDLCPDCHERFLRDPLGKEQGQKLYFSEN